MADRHHWWRCPTIEPCCASVAAVGPLLELFALPWTPIVYATPSCECVVLVSRVRVFAAHTHNLLSQLPEAALCGAG